MAKRKGQQDNDPQNTTQKTKDRVTRTPLSHRLKKERQYNDQKKGRTRQTMIYKTLHRKLKIEQHEPH
jgi:hypothetical protein